MYYTSSQNSRCLSKLYKQIEAKLNLFYDRHLTELAIKRRQIQLSVNANKWKKRFQPWLELGRIFYFTENKILLFEISFITNPRTIPASKCKINIFRVFSNSPQVFLYCRNYLKSILNAFQSVLANRIQFQIFLCEFFDIYTYFIQLNLQFKMNESSSVQKFYSLNQSKSLSIHQGNLNSFLVFSEFKQQQTQAKSNLQKNIDNIESLIIQLQHEQEQCRILEQQIASSKQSYYIFRADLERFIAEQEEQIKRRQNQQQESQCEKLNKKTQRVITKTRELLSKNARPVDVRMIGIKKLI